MKPSSSLLINKKVLGIAIYPNHAPQHEIINYLKLARKHGFKRVFTNLIGLSKADLEKFARVCQFGQNLGLQMVVDIDDTTCQMLGHNFTDQAYFKKLGVSGIRLDVKFDARKIGALTCKKELEYEVNASDFSGLDKELATVLFKPQYLVASHNFYPQRYTGLSESKFMRANCLWKKLGVRISAFVTLLGKKAISAWKEAVGTPTLEVHREMDLVSQIQYLGFVEAVDIIIVANMYLEEVQMQQIKQLKTNKIMFKIIRDVMVTDDEATILDWDGHQIRGDNNEYFLRSTIARKQFAHLSIPERQHNLKVFEKGTVLILNEHAGRYKGELHVLKKAIRTSRDKNVIGTIAKSQLALLAFDKPHLKFGFWK